MCDRVCVDSIVCAFDRLCSQCDSVCIVNVTDNAYVSDMVCELCMSRMGSV